MKTKSLIVSFMAMLLAFGLGGCYVHRAYDPYYDARYLKGYKHKHKHLNHRDDDRDRDHDRDEDRYSRY